MSYICVIDGGGVYGSILHYTLVCGFFGVALVIFLYLWKIKRLDMDEEPKFQMMEEKILEKPRDDSRSNPHE